MTRRHGVLSIYERCLMIVGLLCLTLFVVAMIHRGVYSQLALRNFDKGQAVPIDRELKTAPLEKQRTDFTLWSEKRVQAYRESLPIFKDSPLAILRLEKFNLRVPVFEGTGELALNRGAGWILGTARPGETGNIGIAGHRDGFFRPLKDIATGDVIELSTPGVKALYTVDQIEIVNPDNVGVLRPRRMPSLTLTTCYPFYFIGDAPQRFIVHAVLKQRVAVGIFDRGSASARAN